jgi:glycosyltransferase involved in cell wall biosynthesis
MAIQPKRVLMTADTVGGVWTYSLELAKALAPNGVEIALATMGAPLSNHQRMQVRRLPNVQLYESAFKLEWMDDPWADVARAGDWLLTLENEINPEVIHLNGYAHGALPWREPHLVVGHSCVLSWWRAVKREAAPEEWREYARAVSRGLRDADLVVAPSRAMMADLRRHYGPLDSTAVIPNGRDCSLYSPMPKRHCILAAGRLWDEAKNIAALDKAAANLDWPVYVAGDPAHPRGSHYRPRHLKLLGSLSESELASKLARSAIYALPARYEPFGLSILEAGLAGCALVLGDIPSLRENWEGAAIFIAPDHTAALEAALSSLIGNEHRRRCLGAKAHERAVSFSPERMAAGYLCAYARLTEASKISPTAVS